MKNINIEKIEYRKLKSNESKKYRFLRLESLKKYPNSFGSKYEEQKQREKLSFENFIENSNPECFIVGALHQDMLIGICGFYRHKDNYCNHRGEIVQMYVQPKYHGNQIGFNLLNTTITEAFKIEELEQIELQVMSNIKPANKIYEKIGFQESGIQKRFYKKNGVYFDQRLMTFYRKNKN
ncbi:MAG: GNAT family protein [Bacteroidota bacterium]